MRISPRDRHEETIDARRIRGERETRGRDTRRRQTCAETNTPTQRDTDTRTEGHTETMEEADTRTETDTWRDINTLRQRQRHGEGETETETETHRLLPPLLCYSSTRHNKNEFAWCLESRQSPTRDLVLGFPKTILVTLGKLKLPISNGPVLFCGSRLQHASSEQLDPR